MNVLSSNVLPQFGLKLGKAFYDLRPEHSLLSSMGKQGLFFEYQAPRLCVEDLAEYHGIAISDLRPHSVLISTVNNLKPAQSIIDKLAEECRLTNTPYLAEHIGYLSPNPRGASLGYLISPALNSRSIDLICNNVSEMQKTISVPIALENPVFYIKNKDDQFDLPNFIYQTGRRLPSNVGWLIDFAHLAASCKNLGNISIEDVLDAYKESGRHIYELHIANTRTDKNGATHDDHNTSIEVSDISKIVALIRKTQIDVQYTTFERNISSQLDVLNVMSEIQSARNLFQGAYVNSIKDDRVETIRVCSQESLAQAERKGRISILSNRLIDDLSTIDASELENLAKDFGYSDFNKLVETFFDMPFHWAHEKSLPQFSLFEMDHSDTLTPFYSFLREHLSETGIAKPILRQILLEIAIRQATIVRALGYAGEFKIILSIEGDAPEVDKGIYLLSVNEEWDVEVEDIDNEFILNNGGTNALFCEKGGISWPRKNVLSAAMLKAESSKAKIHTDGKAEIRGAV